MQVGEQRVIEDYDSEVEILTRLSTIITERPLIERRKEIRKSLLIVTLNDCEIDKEYDIEEISSKLQKVTKCTLSDQQILQVLSELEKENLVKHVHTFKYKIISKPDILNFEELCEPVWNEFRTFMKERFPKYDPFIHNNAQKIFILVMKKIIGRLSISKSLNNQEFFPVNNIEKDIANEIKNLHLPELDEKLPDLLVQYLNSKAPELNNFVFNCYYGLINIDLISREQEMPDFDFGKEIEFLLLDTNFIVPLMCQYDNVHALSVAIVKQCDKLKIPLYYTSKTKFEIWGLIKGSTSLMKELSSRKVDPTSNQFVNNYVKMDVNWSNYYTYLSTWEEFIFETHSICRIPIEMEQNIDEKTYEFVRYSLPFVDSVRFEKRSKKDISYVPHTRSEENYTHDAYCIGLINFLKRNKSSISKKLGPWFLTYDNLLSHLNSNSFISDDDFGLVMQPRNLLNYLLVYSKVKFNNDDREEVAVALITLTTKSQKLELTLESYSKIVAAKLQLGINTSEKIMQMFARSPLLEELKSALINESDKGADTIAYNILTSPEIDKIIDKIYSQDKIKLRDEQVISDLKSQIKIVKEKYIEEKAAKEALEKVTKEFTKDINVTVHVKNEIRTEIKIDHDVPLNLRSLISLLENEGAFSENIVEAPPSNLSLEKASMWVENIKRSIEAGTEIKQSIKAILPYINVVLQSLPHIS